VRQHDLDDGRDWDRQQRPGDPGKLRSGQDRNENGQWRQADGTAHDPRHQNRVLRELQQDDEADHQERLLPSLGQGNDDRGDTAQPRPQNWDDLGNPSPQAEERPELDAEDRVADGGGNADDQAERQLPA
jgi:hypothetical protein